MLTNSNVLTAATTSTSGEQIWMWIVIGGIVLGAAIACLKYISAVDERYVHQKQYEKDIEVLKERFFTDMARHDKLIERLEKLTEAIASHYKR